MNTTGNMFQNFKLVVELLKAKAAFITSIRRMFYKVMVLQFLTCEVPLWTFTAHIVFHTTVHS